MIYSDNRKLALSGWLYKESREEHSSPLKLQKFLFLYESMSKINGENYDFSHLRGYERGPVFSQVWGDYTKDNPEFIEKAVQVYERDPSLIKEKRAKLCSFIVKVFTEEELSDITHEMNIWKSKENRILSGEYQVSLEEKDFNDKDRNIIGNLQDAFSIEFIENSHVIDIGNKKFVISIENNKKLNANHYDILYKIALNGSLENPVYMQIDDEGVLIID